MLSPRHTPDAHDAAPGSAGAGASSHQYGQPTPTPASAPAPALGRLNLLLSAAGPVAWRDESWAESLSRLLEPMGVRAWRVRSGREAADVIRSMTVHIALVDLGLPLDGPAPSAQSEANSAAGGSGPVSEGGARLLDLLARLSCPPPTVVVNRGRSQRDDTRTLCSALQAGAFAVLERPVQIETALEVMRRILTRHYAGRWPGCDQ